MVYMFLQGQITQLKLMTAVRMGFTIWHQGSHSVAPLHPEPGLNMRILWEPPNDSLRATSRDPPNIPPAAR